jgi:SAM-dependent methyltransferase
MDGRLLLNLGCGPEAEATNWTDVDGSLNLLWQRWLPSGVRHFLRRRMRLMSWPVHVRYLDLRRPLPFATSSVDAIYASHVLEHLYVEDAERLLRECQRVLRPGGYLRLVLPDLRSMVAEYLAAADPEAALRLNRRLLFRPERRPQGLWHRLQAAFGDMHSHKFMYDLPCLSQRLAVAGFSDIRGMDYLESRIPETPQVERAGRILQGEGFVIEALKGHGAA